MEKLTHHSNEIIYENYLKKIQNIYFTRREIDILAGVLSGLTAKSIAAVLFISHRTVEQHFRSIMRKINCNSKEKVITFIENSGTYNHLKEYGNYMITKENGLQFDSMETLATQEAMKSMKKETYSLNQIKQFLAVLSKKIILSNFIAFKPFTILMCTVIAIILFYALLWIKQKTELSFEEVHFPQHESQLFQKALKANKKVTWCLPKQNHKFIGREKLLEKLDTLLQKNSKKKLKTNIATASKKNGRLAISACAGLGGIGKTQLALQYVYHCKHSYTLKAWFPAENLDQLRQKYIEFAKVLGCSINEITIDLAITYIKNWLAEHPGWLIVFDNVENYEEISPFLPDTGGDVILTTRQRNWPLTFNTLAVDIMSEEESIRLIESLISNVSNRNSAIGNTSSENDSCENIVNDKEEIKKLVKTLGYLPLALAQAGAFIKLNQISIQRYLELYNGFEQTLLADKQFTMESDMSIPVSVTWNITLSKISQSASEHQEGLLAISLLTACSYLAPERISRQTLLRWFKKSYPEFKEPEIMLNKCLGILWQYSMINYDGVDFINVHRLVQAVLYFQHKQSLERNTEAGQLLRAAWYDKLFSVLHEEFSIKSEVLQDEDRKRNIFPQLQALVKNYVSDLKITKRNSLSYGYILQDIGDIFYFLLWDAKSAITFYSQALNIMEAYYGKEHIETAQLLTYLADTYGTLGNPQKQRDFAKKALKIKEEHYGINHASLIGPLDSLGASLWAMGQAREGILHLKRSLKLGEHFFGKHANEISETLLYLGHASGDVNDERGKEEYLERCLFIKEKYYGRDNIQVALPLVGLGVSYQKQGNLLKSKQFLERAARIQKNYYQYDHVEWGETLGNLGNTYLALGDSQKAKATFQEAVRILEKYYGPNHAYVARTLHYLGRAHLQLNEFDQALPILEKVLIIKEKFYGKDHEQVQQLNCELNSF